MPTANLPCTKRTCCDLGCYRRFLRRPALRCLVRYSPKKDLSGCPICKKGGVNA